MRIGVLAIQGDFAEHRATLQRIGVGSVAVRLPGDLEGVGGLIIPGGESTTMARLIDAYGLRQPIRARAAAGLPVWGTCAGMIMLATRLTDARPTPLGIIDIEVSRNAFGRQVDSFEADLEIEAIGAPPFHAVFIRAPVVQSVAAEVEVLARLEDGRPVAVRHGAHLATAFHPELTGDDRLHQLFVSLVGDREPVAVGPVVGPAVAPRHGD